MHNGVEIVFNCRDIKLRSYIYEFFEIEMNRVFLSNVSDSFREIHHLVIIKTYMVSIDFRKAGNRKIKVLL